MLSGFIVKLRAVTGCRREVLNFLPQIVSVHQGNCRYEASQTHVAVSQFTDENIQG